MSARTDIAVVGAGVAGLYVALTAADHGAQVTLLSRKRLAETASYWAQGGLAAAIGDDDEPDLHAADTLRAGREMCRSDAVRALVEGAPAAVRDLQRRGVAFDLDAEGELVLGLEGGHSRRRVVHAGGSATGRRITRELSAQVANHERIDVREGSSVLALWADGARCHGVVTEGGEIAAGATVLATGGAAALWRRTSNPWGAIGAGLVLAGAAGADLADLEFCQFHPTALALPGSDHDGFLVTEAIRGEGARLLDDEGREFTDSLAPRDEVTAAILELMGAGAEHVWLDMRDVDPLRFPNITETLRAAGLDPRAEALPVSPAAHYVMGGIAVDVHGCSSLQGLLAVGECATNGLHGANRLASNSLSECFVFGARAAEAAGAVSPRGSEPPVPAWRFEPPTVETRDAMWRRAGPLRDPEDLERLLDDPYPLARWIARAALERVETRGPHRRVDAPRTDPDLDRTHLVLGGEDEVRRELWE